MNKILLLLIVVISFVSCADKTDNSEKINKDDWDELIVNNSLDGWHIYQDNGSKKGWIVEDGELIFNGLSDMESGEGDASLLSDKMYENFEIKFDWKIEEGGNSGFMWGVREDTMYHYPYQTGPEIQILDHAIYEKPEDTQGGEIEVNNVLEDLEEYRHFIGALYDLSPPTIKDAAKPAGEWNSYHILVDHKANIGAVRLNRQEINTFPLHGKGWDKMIAESKFSRSEDFPYLGNARWSGFGKYSKGFICFQDHPGRASFRNIKIRELY